MEKKKNVPVLRFPEFSGDWEKKNIGNHIDNLTGFAFKGEDISENSDGILLMRGINISEGVIRHTKEIDRFYIGNPNKYAKFILKEGDVVIGMDGSKVGKNSAIIDSNNANSILIQRVTRLRENNNSSLLFIYQHINSNIFHKYVDLVKTSSGIPHISTSQINEFKIGFPTFPEQQKIASFLTLIDNKIKDLKEKKNLLEQYKKGMMQKIFSQELRFIDNNGAAFPKWEKKKFGDIGEIITGKTPSTSDTELWNGNIQFVTPTDINENKYQNNTARTVKENSKVKVLPSKSIMFTCIASIGKMSLSIYPCITNQQINSIIPKKDFNNEFIYYTILNMVDYIKSTESSNTLPIINKTDFSKFSLLIPNSFEEQTKIANFLSAIDDKINLCNAQIEKTEQWKKGLLQKMFV